MHDITVDMEFSEDVVKERGYHMIPYKPERVYELTDPAHIQVTKLPARRPWKKRVPRLYVNTARSLRRATVPKETRPPKFVKPVPKIDIPKPQEKDIEDEGDFEDNDLLMTVKTAGTDTTWDQHLLSLLSPSTANFLVHKRTKDAHYQDSLIALLRDWYGRPRHTELIRDSVAPTPIDHKMETKEDGQWSKIETRLIQRALDIPDEDQESSGESEVDRAPFRVKSPYFKPKQKSFEEITINRTAEELKLHRQTTPPIPSVKDLLNPKIGDKVYETDNKYQKEMILGKGHVFHPFGDNETLETTSHNEYQKSLQAVSPRDPDDWMGDDETQYHHKSPTLVKRVSKGHQRWKGLPEYVQTETALLKRREITSIEHTQTMAPTLKLQKMIRTNMALASIVHEWKVRWHLTNKRSDVVSIDQLLTDMQNMNPNVRAQAVLACNGISESNAKMLEWEQNAAKYEGKKAKDHADSSRLLPERLAVALECLCHDRMMKVRLGAAVTLYSIQRPYPEAGKILREALKWDNLFDRWAAAQCLATCGECDSEIVDVIMQKYFLPDDLVQKQQAIKLLVQMSSISHTVHAMLAEQLNHSSWYHRVLACNLLPSLMGSVNQDILNKLGHMLWNDWHSEVRKAAAHALGRTGNGKFVHKDLVEKLRKGNEADRLGCLTKIAFLGVMTTSLLEEFIECFDDSYISVRIEACRTSAKLSLKDEKVINKLAKMAQYETATKVKSVAIRALGDIGCRDGVVRRCLLWALRFEQHACVRHGACKAIKKLKFDDGESVHILNERLLVENADEVRQEITECLDTFGISDSQDMETVSQIKREVHKLCSFERIFQNIAIIEEHENRMSDRKERIQNPVIQQEPNFDVLPPLPTKHKPRSRKVDTSLSASFMSPMSSQSFQLQSDRSRVTFDLDDEDDESRSSSSSSATSFVVSEGEDDDETLDGAEGTPSLRSSMFDQVSIPPSVREEEEPNELSPGMNMNSSLAVDIYSNQDLASTTVSFAADRKADSSSETDFETVTEKSSSMAVVLSRTNESSDDIAQNES